jgi:hypothetical protein
VVQQFTASKFWPPGAWIFSLCCINENCVYSKIHSGRVLVPGGRCYEDLKYFNMKKAVATVLSVSSPADFLIFSFYPEDRGDMFLRNVG